jgi:hypothetical protein
MDRDRWLMSIPLATALLTTILAGVGAPAGASAAPVQEPAVRVLFVGNSYTYFNNVPAQVSALAAAGGHRLETKMVAPGGWRLRDHFEKGDALRALHEAHWDYVVLQEQSTLGTNLYVDGLPRVAGDQVFRPWAEKWVAEIAQAGAKPVFYLTWARKKTPLDQATLDEAVLGVARATHTMVAPVGPAWALARAARPSLELYFEDGSHPSPAGSYLAACTLYATLFQASPAALPGKLSGEPVDLDTEKVKVGTLAVLADLGSDDARALQEAAWQAVENLTKQSAAPVRAPAPVGPAPLPHGTPLTERSLAGSWSGSLAFSPNGPAGLALELDAPQTKGAAWSGYARLEFHSKDAADLEVELTDLKVGADELSFSIPKAVLELDVAFRAVVSAEGELTGHAEANREDDEGPLRLLGSWSLRRKD